jgi:hypothetical protein
VVFGGITAVVALVQRTLGPTHRATATLVALGAMGAALFNGDSAITPALSAVEGLKVVDPAEEMFLAGAGAARRLGDLTSPESLTSLKCAPGSNNSSSLSAGFGPGAGELCRHPVPMNRDARARRHARASALSPGPRRAAVPPPNAGLFPLIPRDTPRWRKLYNCRGAVEREFGRLKNDWALSPLSVRGLDRIRLQADLTILAKLACALSRARIVPLVA